jgi:subtilisin-like proprotein convertase family protein
MRAVARGPTFFLENAFLRRRVMSGRSTRIAALVVGLGMAVSTLSVGGSAPAEASPAALSFEGSGFGPIPDGPTSCPGVGFPLDVAFSVTGITPPLTDVRVTGLTFGPSHPYVGDLRVALIAPNGQSHALFARTGAMTSTGLGDSSDVTGPYSFADDASGDWWAAASAAGAVTPVPAGSYRTSQPGGTGSPGALTSLTAAFAGLVAPNGTWRLRFVDYCVGDTGSVTAATLTLTGTPDCTAQQASLTSATAAAISADQSLTTAEGTVTKAETRVSKAKKKLKAAKKDGDDGRIKKAKKKLKKAEKALKQARALRGAAEQQAVAAHQQQAAAQAALASCQHP